MTEMLARHLPVSQERFWELACPALARPNPVYLDATIGAGGHAALVAARNPDVRIIGLDRDLDAVEQAQGRLGRQAEVVHCPFAELSLVLDRMDVPEVDAVLFDLGVSSMQLDCDERGFAYSRDTELDMRMDRTAELTAASVLATYSQTELARVLRDYGQERFASAIARRIVAERQRRPIESSYQLVELIRSAIPAPARRTGGNPAKRTFQALRIEVNGELDQIARALPQAIGRLRKAGRVIVMSYQSLEDRLVKDILRAGAVSSAPPGLPIEPDFARPYLKLLTRGAERASQDEQAANPRSRPVRLRAAERIGDIR
jgi:16S rRNA (cytosine1402-N4)-methyltransferase